MGWFALAGIAAAALAAMLLLRLPRALLGFAGAAIMLGGAGYALQGSPALPAAAPAPVDGDALAEPELVELRQQLFGRFQYSDSYFFIADALARSGDERAAARAMLGGIRTAPDSLPLWTGFAFRTAGADGAMSPAARVAFRRAHLLNPHHPGVYFYEGLAYVRLGELDRARDLWRRALRVGSPGAPWREGVALRLVLLERFIAMRAAGQVPPSGANR
jgi:cytochrome c-type biogenesis protein CcmH